MNILDSESLKMWEAVADLGFKGVIFGVAGEGVEICIKLFAKKWWNKWQRPLEIIGAIFWMILVVGLAVEYKGNKEVVKLIDAENGRLDREAGMARRESGESIKQAALANEHSLILTQQPDAMICTNFEPIMRNPKAIPPW